MQKQPVRGNLSDFIKANMGSQFVIPVYQRNYAWNPEKETARFMDDIQDLLVQTNASHFLGIIIYMETSLSGVFRQLQIVDGQQRLTTAFIFLLALKKTALEKNDEETAGIIDDYYLFNKHAPQNTALRLKPAVSSDDVYARLVYGNVDSFSQHDKDTYVYRNYEYICRRIRKLAEIYSLQQILDTLSRVDILEFPLSAGDNAQQIFESINAAGAPLTSADLIRNYILMNHPDDLQERLYRMYWQPLEQQFTDSRRLEEFFRYYLAIKTYSLLSRKDVYEGFKQYWHSRKESTENLLQEINRYAGYYDRIYHGEMEGKEAEAACAAFRVSASRLPAPFLMEAARLYLQNQIPESAFARTVRLIDSYLTRRALCGMDNSQLGRYFPILLRSVMRTFTKTHGDFHAITVNDLVTYNRSNANVMPTDEQLRVQLREINAYSLMVLRPVLERIEQDGASVKVDTSSLNIEHIMPQHPNAWWKKHAGTANEDEYAFYANLIGNLTLCAQDDNTRMGNEDFAYKKKILGKTMHIRMNTEILQSPVWNKDTILKRCDELAERIIAIYPYEEENVRQDEHTEDDVLVLSSPSANARAIFHHSMNIEVLPGTVFKAYGQRDMRRMHRMYDDFLARGIVSEDDSGMAHFVQNAEFASLNEAAQFLMHRGGENTSAWTYEDGRRIGGTSKELAEAVKRKKEAVNTEDIQKKTNPEKQEHKQNRKPVHHRSTHTADAHGKHAHSEKKSRPADTKPVKKAAHQNASGHAHTNTKAKTGTHAGNTKHRSVSVKASSSKKPGAQANHQGSGKAGNRSSSRRRNNRGFAPQSAHSLSEKQTVAITRFAGQGS